MFSPSGIIIGTYLGIDTNVGTGRLTQSPMPPEWHSVVDPDSGHTYYHNSDTEEATWATRRLLIKALSMEQPIKRKGGARR